MIDLGKPFGFSDEAVAGTEHQPVTDDPEGNGTDAEVH